MLFAVAVVLSGTATAKSDFRTASPDTLKVFGSFVLENGKDVPVYLCADLKEKSLQSISIDRERGLLRTLTNQHDRLRTFDLEGNFLGQVTKPSTGHNNDMCLVSDNLYIVGTRDISSPELYRYSLSDNTAERLDADAVRHWGRDRDLSGVCELDRNTLLLVARENMEDIHGPNDPSDKLGIYKMDKRTGRIVQWFELPWHGIFVQGITCVNGYLFIATNMLYNVHGGTSVWVVDLNRKKLVDEMKLFFEGEAEGIDYNIENGKVWLYIGLGSPEGKFALVGKAECPYPAKNSPSWEVTDSLDIKWKVSKTELPHSDHIEMTGEKISTVLFWSLDSRGKMTLDRSLIFPLLRTVPNETASAFRCHTAIYIPDLLIVDGMRPRFETTEEVRIDGTFNYRSSFSLGTDYRATNYLLPGTLGLEVNAFPCVDKAAYIEKYRLTNRTRDELTVMVPEYSTRYVSPQEKGVQGSYILETRIVGNGTYTLKKGESVTFHVVFSAYPAKGEADRVNPQEEYDGRRSFVRNDMDSSLILDTPDDVVDAMFRFSKIRASECIMKTKRGYMHNPGGTAFYAAVWCNDESEYTAPLTPFIGYWKGKEAAMNCADLYGAYMKPDYQDIPSSIISEGDGTWQGAGDRGDAAMLAYGAARYALASGSREDALRVWSEIEWCLEYCRRKITADGVVASDSDELENRFPSGDANLCTSCLYYDALLSSAFLNDALGGDRRISKEYRERAAQLEKAIESFFGAEIHGYRTYRYYDGNTVLRSWICIPLTVGIFDRAEDTVKALFSDYLWSPQGCLTAEGGKIYWDRTTLYGLRGAYAAGAVREATENLQYYSRLRLLGDHVPYAVEAWPEGGQAHLAGESALFARIVTEGMFGIRPTGFSSFEMTPRLPELWPQMSLRHIRAFGKDFDIIVSREGKKLNVKVTNEGRTVLAKKVREGEKITVRFTR